MTRDYTYPSTRFATFLKRRKVGDVVRIDATAFIAEVLREMRQVRLVDGGRFRTIKTYDQAQELLEIINNPRSQLHTLLQVKGSDYPLRWQRMDCVRSNLGSGYLFYFICTECGRRAKHLYMPESHYSFQCRQCYGLRYPTVRRSDSADSAEKPSGTVSAFTPKMPRFHPRASKAKIDYPASLSQPQPLPIIPFSEAKKHNLGRRLGLK